MQSIAVIGGGITGVTTAYALAKRGFSVTLFERQRYAAMETSFANGGQLSASNAEVWNHWATIWKGMKWMLRGDAPLLVNPKPSWHKLSWFAQFTAQIGNYRDNTVASTRLAIAAREHLYGWAKAENIDFDLKHAGILHVYRNKAGFDHAAEVSKLLAEGGLTRRAVTPEEMRAIEPTLLGAYYGGFFTESDATGDIHKYTVGLAAAAERAGVRILYAQQVRHLHSDGSSVRVTVAATTSAATATATGGASPAGGEPAQQHRFDAVVVCAGVDSRKFAAQLGDRVNIYPVKGYSITVHLLDANSQASAPTVSLLDDEAKLVSSRLGTERFRVAGTAEFNGYNHDIRAERIRPLVDWVNACFPGVSTRQVVPWTGLRPMMPNLMPRVGQGRRANVFYNTGHGHLGWTLGAATAEMVAEQMLQAQQASGARAVGSAGLASQKA